MLRILLNNQEVDAQGVSFKYVMNSPAFSESPIAGDFSYPLSLMLTPTNKKILGFIHRHDSATGAVFDCLVYDGGLLVIEGVFRATKSTDEYVSGNIENPAYDFAKQIVDKKTNDLDLGGSTQFDTIEDFEDYMAAANEGGAYPTYKFAWFPVLNVSLFEGFDRSNDLWSNQIKYINQDEATLNTVLFPYFAYILEQLFITFHITPRSNPIASDSELASLVLYSPFKDETQRGTVPTMYPYFNLKESCGRFDLAKLLLGTKDTFCLSFHFRGQDVYMILNKDILTAKVIDYSSKVVSGSERDLGDSDVQGHDLGYEFDPTDSVFEDKQLEPTNAFDTCTIKGSVDKFADLASLPGISVEGDCWLVKNESAWYRRTVDPDTAFWSWVFLTFDYFAVQNIIDGKDPQQIRSIMSTLPMNVTTDAPYASLPVPWSDQAIMENAVKGINKWHTTDYPWTNLNFNYLNEFNPRLLFYRGYWTIGGIKKFYYASGDIYNPYGTAYSGAKGNYSMRWDGTKGLFEKFHKEWVSFIDKATVHRFKVKLTVDDVVNFDFRKRYRVGGNLFVARKLTVDFPVSNPAEIELMRINL